MAFGHKTGKFKFDLSKNNLAVLKQNILQIQLYISKCPKNARQVRVSTVYILGMVI